MGVLQNVIAACNEKFAGICRLGFQSKEVKRRIDYSKSVQKENVKRIKEILEERALELAFEGHRWFDLRRTTRPRIEKVLNGQAYLLEQDDSRYTLRIPQSAIAANPGLLN